MYARNVHIYIRLYVNHSVYLGAWNEYYEMRRKICGAIYRAYMCKHAFRWETFKCINCISGNVWIIFIFEFIMVIVTRSYFRMKLFCCWYVWQGWRRRLCYFPRFLDSFYTWWGQSMSEKRGSSVLEVLIIYQGNPLGWITQSRTSHWGREI